MTIHLDDFSVDGRPTDVEIDLTAPTKSLVFFANDPAVMAELARRGELGTIEPVPTDDEMKVEPRHWSRRGGGPAHFGPVAPADPTKVDLSSYEALAERLDVLKTEVKDLSYYEEIEAKFRDIASERRIPRGSEHAGRWTTGGGIEQVVHPTPLSPRQEQVRGQGGKPFRDPEKANADLSEDPTSLANLPEETRIQLIDHVRESFGVTSEQMDANLEDLFNRASPETVAEGSAWYAQRQEQMRALAADTGFSMETVTGVTAALSPQTDWEANYAQASYVLHVAHGDWPLTAADLEALRTETRTKKRKDGKVTLSLMEWAEVEARDAGEQWTEPTEGSRLSSYTGSVAGSLIKAMAQAGLHTPDGLPLHATNFKGNEQGVGWGSGLDGLVKANRIIDGADPADVLNGHKVRSFYNNILLAEDNPFDDITIDTHALSAAVGRKIPSMSPLVAKGLNQPSNVRLGLVGTYPVFAETYRRLGARHGLTGHQVQAIAWIQWRIEHPPTSERRPKGTP